MVWESGVDQGEIAGSAAGVIPCGPVLLMMELGQSEATLSAAAIRGPCLQANGGH